MRKALKWGAAALATVGFATAANAQAPAMDPVTFPVDTASIASEIATAGGTILLLSFGVILGFALVRKLMKRVKAAV